MSKFEWKHIDFDKNKALALQDELKIHPILCNLLVQRGIENFEDAKQFFRPSLTHLHHPFLMLNMDKAVNRVIEAIEKNEKILIYGDYDVDGTTSVALMHTFLQKIYQNFDFYIPDRHKEGYGISTLGIDYAESINASLIIALDCGIKAIDKVNYANKKNIDFIICDHHTPGDSIPQAVAILNPKQEDCIYPYKELSGCGIGFKLCQALAEKLEIPFKKVENLLDFVCISIACDIVPINGENRTLAFFGLKKLNSNPNKGVNNIVELLKLNKAFTISDIVFKIGPRINAAGRVAHAKEAVNVLIGKADVNHLQEKNTERQELDKQTTLEALDSILKSNFDAKKRSTVVYQENWHKGVIGIVASRLIEHHYKPTIVFCESNGKLTGSARSVEGFNVYEAIDECSELLLNFGGHAYAAGLTIAKSDYEKFVEKFEKAVAKRILPKHLFPKINIDAELQLSDITSNFYNILKQFAPFGPQNMRPNFVSKKLRDTGYSRIVGENHLKINAIDSKGHTISGIAFQMADKEAIVKDGFFDVCYHLVENEWNDKISLEMMVQDIRKSP